MVPVFYRFHVLAVKRCKTFLRDFLHIQARHTVCIAGTFEIALENAKFSIKNLDQHVATIVTFLQDTEKKGSRPRKPRRHLEEDFDRKGRRRMSSFPERNARHSKRDRTNDEHRFSKIHNMLQSGDRGAHASFMDSFSKTINERFYNNDRDQEGRRRLDKAAMCTQLAKCASKMSFYDSFVYFNSVSFVFYILLFAHIGDTSHVFYAL